MEKARTIVSQLSKYLKLKSVRGDKNDCILYKITPRNVTNFRHLLSYNTIDHFEIFCFFFFSVQNKLAKRYLDA